MNMNSTNKGSARARLLTSTLLAGFATVAAPMAALTFATFAPAVASAQDYQNGTLIGTVNDTSGAPIVGATVVVKSLAQGFERNLTTNSSGEFRAALIPSGAYSVVINKGGYVGANDGNVAVRSGSSSNYSFILAAEGEAVSEVVITGTANPQLDFANTTTGLVVDVETLSKQVPIARNVTALTLLAPSAIPGDSAAGFTQQGQSQAAIGGSSIGENVFYVNGLNITNFVNGIGGTTVPFEFYKSVEVKTGGFPAEFGRGTGAMINAVTKSGSNDFTFAVHGNYEPNSLREQAPNALARRNSMSKRTDKSLIVEAGGPIIPDHLFFYGLASFNSLKTQSAVNVFNPAAGTQNNATKFRTSDPFYAFKLDGYITDRQHLEFTYFDTSRKQKSDVYRYSLDTDQIVGPRTAANTLYQGGENYVARYTGSFTDWLTVSAAYGRSEVDNANLGNLSGESVVSDQRVGSTVISRQTTAASTFPFIAEREFYRGDVDLYFKLLGSHHIRAGYDRENTTLTEFTKRNGGYNYIYRRAAVGDNLGGLIAPGQEYVELRKFETGGGFEGVNKAIYIQDAWDITDRLTLNLGVRRDQFSVADPNGQVFSSFDDEIGLRMGFAYDVFGDRNDKLYGSYGRTYVPVASNTAFRAASPAIDNSQFFLPAGGAVTFTGLSPVTGLPTAGLGAQIIGTAANPGALQACDAAVGSIAPAGSFACVTRNNGRSPDPEAVAAQNLGSTFQDEWILGYEHRFGPLWKAGVNLTYRTLGRVSEDALLDYGIQNWCLANGYPSVRAASGRGGTGCAGIWSGEHQYLIINPGKDAVITLSDPLPGETQIRTITVTAAQMGFPKVKREYLGLEFNFERSFDGKWGLQGSYVVSESKGNFEGQARSDNGQTDAGITVDFDHLAFVPGSYGPLPNHRGHQLKLFGSYALTDNLLFGGNLSVVSPRKYGCIGFAPDGSAPDWQVANSGYGAASRFCNSQLVNRGSAFKSDWVTRFDVSVRYTVPAKFVPSLPMIGSDDSSLVLRADIFNIFNLDSVVERNEFGESALNVRRPDFMSPTEYQAPRSIRFGFDLQF